VDESDLARCYQQHGADLLHFATSQVGTSDADDVLASAVVDVLRRFRKSGEPSAGEIEDPLQYLYRAVANSSAKHWRTMERRSERNTTFHLQSERLQTGPDGPGGHDLPEEISAMLDVMHTLTAPQRAAIHLTYWEDLTPVMVADRLGVSEGTIRRQLARARAKIREALDD